jgi:YD repeat-containing protein
MQQRSSQDHLPGTSSGIPVWAAGAVMLVLVLAVPGMTPGPRAQGAAYQVYQYDSLGNLIRSWDGTGRDAAFAYDPADNRTGVAVTQGTAPPAPQPPAPLPVPRYQVLPRPGGAPVVIPYGR